MGNCTVKRSKKASENYTSSVKIKVPNLFYLSRSEKSMLVVENSESRLYPLQKKIKLFRDSSISLISDSSLIIAGGSDSSSSLTSRVYQIFPYLSELTSLPSLPFPCKSGVFHSYNSTSLIYVGGICESQDNDSSQSEQGAPICRLNSGQKAWEVFTSRTLFDPGKYLKRNVVEDDRSQVANQGTDHAEVFIKDLYEPGSVIVNDCLVLIGGKICIEDKMVTSDKVFSVRLNEEFCIKEEGFVVPVKLMAPSCAVKYQKVFVAGGLLEDMSNNLEVFVIEWDSRSIRKVDIGFDRPVELRYPIFVEDKGIWCFSPPKMLYLREDKKQVFNFGLNSQVPKFEINVVKTTAGEGENEFKKVFVDLSLHISSECKKKVEDKTIDLKQYLEDQLIEKIEDDVEIFIADKKDKQENENNDFQPAIDSVEIELPLENLAINSFRIDEKKYMCYVCNEGLKRIDKSHELFSQSCSHCFSHHSKQFLCPSCSITFCRSCLRKLEKFPLVRPTLLTCSKSHKLSHSSSQSPICIDCSNTIESNHVFCFICDEHLCETCHKLLLNLINSSPNCLKSHNLTWSLKPNPVCSDCLTISSALIHFSCKTCEFIQCVDCLNEKNQPLIITDQTFTKPKENLSYNLHINESSLYEEPDKKSIIENDEKKAGPFEEMDGRQMPDESEIVNNLKRESISYLISMEELRKKIPQKPLRGQKSPIFLSLSPSKISPEKKKGIASKFINSPKEQTLMRKSLGAFHFEKYNKAEYHIPKPIEIKTPVITYSDNSERLPEIHTFRKMSNEQKFGSVEDFNVRESQEVLVFNERNSPTSQNIELAKTSRLRDSLEVKDDFREKIDEFKLNNKNEDQYANDNKSSKKDESSSRKKKNKEKEVDQEIIIEDLTKDKKKKKSKKIEEVQNKPSLNTSHSSSSSTHFHIHLNPIQGSEENLKFLETPNKNSFNSPSNHSNSANSDSQNLVPISTFTNKPVQESENPEPISQIEAPINIDINITSEGPEGPEDTDLLEPSIFFPTMGDEGEQVAPVIDKDQGKNKLQALKAKLNLLTERSDGFSSSSESEKSGFNGFIIGNFQVSDSEPDSIRSKNILEKVNQKLDDSDEYGKNKKNRKSKENKDNEVSDESSSCSMFNPFDVCETFEEISEIRQSESKLKKNIEKVVEGNLSKDRKSSSAKKNKKKIIEIEKEKEKKSDENEKSEDSSKDLKKKKRKHRKKSSSSSGSGYGFVLQYQ